MEPVTKIIPMSTTSSVHIARLLQLSDSACPIGSFAFSCGLESAVAYNIVHNADSLKEFARTTAIQSAFCDGIAAIHAHRSARENNLSGVLNADHSLILVKLNDESRKMLTKMGLKMTELGYNIIPDEILDSFLYHIKNGRTPGTFPVAQGVVFAALGINEKELFISHQYGVINMILSAALRCAKVSHLDTQRILFELLADIDSLYDEVKDFTLDEMHAFCPELDLFTSIHEKGKQRMFMS